LKHFQSLGIETLAGAPSFAKYFGGKDVVNQALRSAPLERLVRNLRRF
jgi:hypothetical protein